MLSKTPETAGHVPDSNPTQRAVEAWRSGELVAFPTETVYGLGADARNPEAVAKIFALKERPTAHPLIVHVADWQQLHGLEIELAGAAQALAEAFWPGPLTLIVPRPSSIPECVTGGRPTVGIRIPMHPVAQALLRSFGGPIAAPSANRFGAISATTAELVRRAFSVDELPCVVDGGPCRLGLESTIVDVSQPESAALLRPGSITTEQLETILQGHPLTTREWSIDPSRSEQAPASGTLSRHYSPKTPVYLVPSAEWHRRVSELADRYPNLACLALSEPSLALPSHVEYRQAPAGPAAYGRQLYQTLHQLDGLSCPLILVEQPPDALAWAAIVDRLHRASSGNPPLN